MTMFKRCRRTVPMLNTAALPDLIFTVLFFFITVTHMRHVTLKVQYRVPEGTELTKLTKKSAITHIYIGKPTEEMRLQAGNSTRIQINDKYADIPAVVDFVTDERSRMSPDDAKIMSVSVRADRDTEMGIMSDLRQAFREAGVLRVNYSAVEKSKK